MSNRHDLGYASKSRSGTRHPSRTGTRATSTNRPSIKKRNSDNIIENGRFSLFLGTLCAALALALVGGAIINDVPLARNDAKDAPAASVALLETVDGGNEANVRAASDTDKGDEGKTAANVAYADTLESTKEALDKKESALSSAQKEIASLQKKIRSYQKEIDSAADEITSLEQDVIEKQDKLAHYAVFLYKNPSPRIMEYMLDSTDVSDMLARTELIYGYADDMAHAASEQKGRIEELEERIREVSAQKDEQVAAKRELRTKEKKLEDEVEALEDKAAKLDAKQKIAEFEKTHQAFDTDFSSGEWKTCTASAYGGSTDSMTPNNARTATGTICNDSSMGVAVPMRWPGYRSLFGKKVEISYGGKSVIAQIVDCGGMQGGGPGGERGLDLQPGVFKALGASSCSDWGLRAVKYRIL